MGKVRFEIAISLDGYVAGPNQSEENPLGEGGMALHEWVLELEAWREPHGREGGEVNASSAVVEESQAGRRRRRHGPQHVRRRPRPLGRRDPGTAGGARTRPSTRPVFVLTHHEREPLEMEGGTTFHFVTDGIESALAQAREAAGGEDVKLGGGAGAAQQYLAAGLVDELQLNVVPVLLGAGERLFDGIGAEVGLEQTARRRGARRHPPQVPSHQLAPLPTPGRGGGESGLEQAGDGLGQPLAAAGQRVLGVGGRPATRRRSTIPAASSCSSRSERVVGETPGSDWRNSLKRAAPLEQA